MDDIHLTVLDGLDTLRFVSPLGNTAEETGLSLSEFGERARSG